MNASSLPAPVLEHKLNDALRRARMSVHFPENFQRGQYVRMQMFDSVTRDIFLQLVHVREQQEIHSHWRF